MSDFDSFFGDLYDDSHRQFRAACRRFAETEIAPHAYEWEEAEIFPRELYKKAADIGIIGAAFPEVYGGSGGDQRMALVVSEELIRGGSTGVLVGLGSHGIGLPPILYLGSEEQKQRWVPPVLAGDKIAALAVTEPGTGSDVAGIKTTATREGDGYRLRGSKLFITSGTRADVISVLARTGSDPHGGLTFFVVERGMPGFTVSRSLKKMGWRASDTAELVFDDVFVPMSHRLGDEGSGFVAVMQNFQNERLSLAGIAVASAQRALELSMQYVQDRTAFGRKIVQFQVTKHKLAQMATQLYGAKSLTYRVAAAMSRGEYVVKEVSMAKNLATDMAEYVCNEAVQIHGGMGYMRETEVERLYRDVRLLPIGGGTREIMHEIISKLLLS